MAFNVAPNNPLAPPNQPNPLAPPIMPPGPSPSLGFQLWAGNPENAMKVQPSMTSPSAPLQPNAGMASAQPPQQQNPLTPPDLNLGPGQAPNVAPKPVIPAPQTMQQDMANNPDQYQRKIASGKVGNILNTIAATAIGAGGGMHGQPGAGAEYALGVLKHDEGVPQANQDEYNARWIAPQQAALKTQQMQGDIAHTAAETNAIPINTQIKQQAAQGTLAKNGLKLVTDEQGNATIVPDEASPAYQKMQLQNDVMQAHADDMRAQQQLRAAQTEVEKSKNDPNSPAYQLSLKRLSIAQQNAQAAGTRSQAYWGRYLQSTKNVDLNGNVLPGAPIISDEAGNQTVVGTANAGTAIKNQSNAAQFNDVHGALDTIENAAANLTGKGGKLNDPIVAAALSQPKGTVGQWVQGAVAKGQMSPEQRDYVLAVQQAHENIQALRKSAGGTATDSAVEKLDNMIPNASTPDIDYLRRQTEQIRATATRLGVGATAAAGGLSVRGNKTTPKAGNPLTPPAKAGAATGSPKVGDSKTFPNGKKGTWDGSGWVAQ